MMRFFVHNLFAKLFLLGLLAVPLALYALSEAKQLAEAGIADEKSPPPPQGGETELKRAQEESAKLAAMPSDLRKELLFPSGRLAGDAGDPYQDLSKAARTRAAILAAHRHFLLQYNGTSLSGDSALKFDPIFSAGLGKDLTARYAKLWSERREQLISKTRLADLRAQLIKADAKTLNDLAKEIRSVVDEYDRRWPGESIVALLRDDLARQQIIVAKDAAEQECIKLEAAWKRLMQFPSVEAIKSTQPQVAVLLQQFKSLAIDLQMRKDAELSKWTGEMIAIWTKRRDFLPDTLTLLEGVDKMLAEARLADFFAACKKLAADYPTDEAKKLIRGIAEDFCTRHLVKQPKDPVKYDEVVTLLGNDKALHDVPRRQVKVYFKNDERRFMMNGDPLKNDGFTEFHAEKMKDDIRHLTVFDAELKDPLPGGILTQIEYTKSQMKPTPKSVAVRFYCEEYRKVDRWNAAAIRAFVKKCEPHKDYLGEIWNRLTAMDKAMSNASELFPIQTN
jgi:hypothetical protein